MLQMYNWYFKSEGGVDLVEVSSLKHQCVLSLSRTFVICMDDRKRTLNVGAGILFSCVGNKILLAQKKNSYIHTTV